MNILNFIKKLLSGFSSEHYSLKAGDVDPELNKKIEVLILNDDKFIIYLDDEYCVQWRCTDEFKEPTHCGEILSVVAILEAKSNFIEDRKILRFVRFQIAEALARCFSGQPIENSKELLKEVDTQISSRNFEVAWRWYFCAALEYSAGIVFFVAVCWLFRDVLSVLIGENVLGILWAAGAGVLGALSSIRLRANRIILDANAGEKIHRLEGFSRILAGLIGAVFVAITYKSGIFSNILKIPEDEKFLVLVLCFVAGASERFIPSLVSAIDKNSSD